MRQNVVLIGKDIYSQVTEIPAPAGADVRKDKNQVPFYLMAYDGIVFMMREDQHEAWANHEMKELKLIAGSRQVRDTNPENGEELDTFHGVDTWAYGGHLTFSAASTVATNEAELLKVGLNVAREFNVDVNDINIALGLSIAKINKAEAEVETNQEVKEKEVAA